MGNRGGLIPLVMEIPTGVDIVESLLRYARRRQRGVYVLSATGIITSLTLRQPTVPGAVIALDGWFQIISLTGLFVPRPSSLGSTGLTDNLAGPQGQVVGGSVVGPLVASGEVMIMAAMFSITDDEDQGPGV